MQNIPPQEKFVIPIGPQHPALKEPGHFEFHVDGEIVIGSSVRLGYVHRGIEKGTEDRNWTQNLYLLERVCGICSHTHALTYALGVEKLAGVSAPPRAQAIRTIMCELERIHSHMLWLGVAAHEGGFDTLFMYSWRDRETVMDLLESLSGNRVNYSANVLGGVKFDINAEQTDTILRGLTFLEERTRHYLDVVKTDRTFLNRTRGVGKMTLEQAKWLGTVGPTARASGVERDVRIDSPFAGYAQFPVKLITVVNGDLEARFEVRILELLESYRLIREILTHMPEGELTTRVPRRIPEGETISRVEAPRGEVFYFIKSNGSEKPERIKIRTPSLCNFGSVLTTVIGQKLADVPMILAGIDPCFSCNDRIATVHRTGDPQPMNWEDIRKYGIEYYR
jgi:NADH-quinone oxidoreductase subunit D